MTTLVQAIWTAASATLSMVFAWRDRTRAAASAVEARRATALQLALSQPGIIVHEGILESAVRERFEIITCHDGHKAVCLKPGAALLLKAGHSLHVKGRLVICSDVVVEKGGQLAFFQAVIGAGAQGGVQGDQQGDPQQGGRQGGVQGDQRGGRQGRQQGGCGEVGLFCSKLGFWDKDKILKSCANRGLCYSPVEHWRGRRALHENRAPTQSAFTPTHGGGLAIALWEPVLEAHVQWHGDLILNPVVQQY